MLGLEAKTDGLGLDLVTRGLGLGLVTFGLGLVSLASLSRPKATIMLNCCCNNSVELLL